MLIELTETELAVVMEYRRKVIELTNIILFAQKHRDEV